VRNYRGDVAASGEARRLPRRRGAARAHGGSSSPLGEYTCWCAPKPMLDAFGHKNNPELEFLSSWRSALMIEGVSQRWDYDQWVSTRHSTPLAQS
jgi:hypothetical protein